ncbi:hypothetical protein ACIRP2_32810 [Streptomyces sp. NPDC101194]|uniref:hypothetical protein n=1 Tax=Streptomyces sp. NPDC101194 TaxID=3366127 RepID=UPI0038112A80
MPRHGPGRRVPERGDPGDPADINSTTCPDDGRGGGAGVTGTFNVDTGDAGAREIRHRLDGELPEDTDPGLLDGTDESPDGEGGNCRKPPTKPALTVATVP